MDKDLIYELNKIGSLMGIKPTLNENPLGRIAKVGVAEAISATKAAMRESINLFKKGAINIEDLKVKLRDDIKGFESYLDPKIIDDLSRKADDIIDTQGRLNAYDNLITKLDDQFDTLQKELQNTKKQFSIDIDSFKRELQVRNESFLNKILSKESLDDVIMDTSKVLDDIDQSTGNPFSDEIIQAFTTKEELDGWLNELVDDYDIVKKRSIDSDNTIDSATKKTQKEILDKTNEGRKSILKEKIRQDPDWKNKFELKKFENETEFNRYVAGLGSEYVELYKKLKKSPENELTTIEKEFIKSCESYVDNPSNSAAKTRMKQIKDSYVVSFTEPWFKNNVLMDFYTRFVEPKFMYTKKRLAKLLKNRTSLIESTREVLLEKMNSSFKNFNRSPDNIINPSNSELKRMIRELLDFSETAAAKEYDNFTSLFDDLCDDLKKHIPDNQLGTFKSWIENVKTTQRSRTDIGMDELITGKPKSVDSVDVTGKIKDSVKDIMKGKLLPDVKVLKERFINKQTILNLFSEGKWYSPAQYQSEMYLRATRKGFKGDYTEYTRSQAARELLVSYGLKMVMIPSITVLAYLIYDVIQSMYTKVPSYDNDYFSMFINLALLQTPITFFLASTLTEEENEWYQYILTQYPGLADETVVGFIDLYKSLVKYGTEEEKLKAETSKDISNYWKNNESQRVFWNTSDIESNRGIMIDSNATIFSIYNGFPVFTDDRNPFISSGKLDAKIAKKLKKYKYRVINSPLTANPIVLLALYKEKVLKGGESYVAEFKNLLSDPTKLKDAIDNLNTVKEKSLSTIQPQLEIGGKWYTLTLKNDDLYYYPVDYISMVKMIEDDNYENVDAALEDKQINNITSLISENTMIDKIKKIILEEEEEKTLRMKDWDEIFTFQRTDDKNPGKYTDVKIKMDSVMDRMPHWRKKYKKQCEDLDNCDDDGEDDSFVRAVIDTHPEAVRILFTKGLANLTSSEDQEDLNEGLHSLLSYIRESKSVEVEVWSVYRHPSSPDKIWSLVKGDYKPKELASMDVKMQQTPGNSVEKKKNSLDELKKKELDAIKTISSDEKKGLMELPIKVKKKIKEKIKQGWTTESPTNDLISFYREDNVDSIFETPIKIYKLRPNEKFFNHIKTAKLSDNIKIGFCRSIHYVDKELDLEKEDSNKINEILSDCQDKFEGKYGQNYL